MPKVLVAEDEQRIRGLLVDTLFGAGYDVIQAWDGEMALEQASQEHPDLVLLDVMMPVMDGFQVLRRMRDLPATRDIPVVLMTAYPPEKGIEAAEKFNVTHYLSKPWDSGVLELTVDTALREAEGQEYQEVTDTALEHDPPKPKRPASRTLTSAFIKTGERLFPLDQKLRGGIQTNSLTLVTGSSLTGKSVFCQYLTNSALQDNHAVAYLTHDSTVQDLVAGMNSIGMPMSEHLAQGRLVVNRLEQATEESLPGLSELSSHIESLPDKYGVIIVDSITKLAAQAPTDKIIDFFQTCRRLCSAGKTIMVVSRLVSLQEDNLLIRVPAICDTHLWMHGGILGEKLVLQIEVVKTDSVELNGNNLVRFQITPRVGMRIIA